MSMIQKKLCHNEKSLGRVQEASANLINLAICIKVPAGEWFSSCPVVTCRVHRILCVAWMPAVVPV